MMIPQSAIEPFGVVGIPKLYGDTNLYCGDSCFEVLGKEFHHLNLLGEDDDYCMNLYDLEEYLREKLKHAGAQSASIKVTPDTPTSHVITVYYAMPHDVRSRCYNALLQMKGGFSIMKGGL